VRKKTQQIKPKVGNETESTFGYLLIIMADHVGKIFLPGDKLDDLNVSEKTGKSILGPGLRHEGEEILVSKPGVLRHKEPNIYWVDCHQKRVIL